MKKITKLKIAKIFLDVPRKQFYFGFQYINESSVKFVQNISKLISKIFTYIKCILYFKRLYW